MALTAAACGGTEEEAISETAAAVSAQTCEIRIGGGGRTTTLRVSLRPGQSHHWRSVRASDFIRSTRGPCRFTIYNSRNFGGRSVQLGSNLSTRIRAGVGVRRKDNGGGDTWRIRSVKIRRSRSSRCRLNIGGNGVRMDYYAMSYSKTPAMDRITQFIGGDCSAKVWKGSGYGGNDRNNRFKYLHPSGRRTSSYDPGFRIRSMKITDHGNSCPWQTREHGRCLPHVKYNSSIFVRSGSSDRDRDGIKDLSENMLAQAFRPVFVFHSSEDATRRGIYRLPTGTAVDEPATIFQVRKRSANTIQIQFMKLWLWDRYDTTFCGGHKGDSQRNSIYLKTPASGPDHGKLWWVYKTSGGIEGELNWQQGSSRIRKPHFEKLRFESGPGGHVVIYFSKGKHHEYMDGGWSGQTDKECWNINAYTNGRGAKRAAVLRAPRGAGDRYGQTNVGRSNRRFFNSLAPYSFRGECIWGCGKFYTSSPASRGFE